ncbi:MAG TPA: hypothetical protein VG890_08505 [Puia sp.]|nr:hypothetical protein [Puia sp.]
MPSVLDTIFGKQTLDEISLEDIYAVLRDFPSFNAAHFLLSKKLKSLDHPAYLEETKKTALYFNNPVWLQLLLEGPEAYEAAVHEHRPVTEEEPAPRAYDEPETAAEQYNEPEPSASHTETIHDVYAQPEITVNDEYEEERAELSTVQSDVISAETETSEPFEGPDSPAAFHETVNDFYAEAGNLNNTKPAEESQAASTGGPSYYADIPEEGIFTENEIFNPTLPDQPTDIAGPEPEDEPTIEPEQIIVLPEESEAGPGSPEIPEEALEAAVSEVVLAESVEREEIPEPVHPELIEAEEVPEAIDQTPVESEQNQEVVHQESAEPETMADDLSGVLSTGFDTMGAELIGQSMVPLEEEPVPLPAFDTKKAEAIVFEPYHMVDYFASQGITLELEDQPADQFGRQLKRFTEWLRVMKKLPKHQPVSDKTDEREAERIRHFAANSLEERDILTETMAEVLVKQGMYENAIALYQKLSLIYPPKSAYFASRIEELKASLP